ncbi:MAG: DUF3987 domain-containing protein, partial [Cyanobacteria bacterium P01_H01_bin.130]
IEKVLLIEVGQIEAVLKLMGRLMPKVGLCWLRDELVGLFKSMDQYKSGGKGEGLQILLTAWNGPLFTRIRRVSHLDSFNLGGQTLSICGGIQPDVARKLFSLQDDPDGLLSRILPCVPKIPDNFARWSEVGVDLYHYLDQVYETLDEIAAKQFHFSPVAEAMYRRRWELLKRGYVKHLENNPSFAYFLGKQCSYVPRFALVLHCLEYACGDRPLTNDIAPETLQRAIALSDYYCGQFVLLQSNAASEQGKLSGDLLKIWQFAAKKGGTVSKRDVQVGFRNKNWKAANIQKLFDAIVAQGLGEIVKKKLVILENDQHDQQNAETQTGKGFDMLQNDQHSINNDQQNGQQTSIDAGSSDGTTVGSTPEMAGDSAENVDHVDQMLIPRSTPQSHTPSGSQPFVDHVDHFQESHEIGDGSEWAINGKSVIIISTTQDTVSGVISIDDVPHDYQDSVANFVRLVDGPSDAPRWLRNVANGPRLKIGDRVNFTGKHFANLRFQPQPWTVTHFRQDWVYVEDSKGDRIPRRKRSNLAPMSQDESQEIEKDS